MRRNLSVAVILLAALTLVLGACTPPASTAPTPAPATEGTAAPSSGINPETGVKVESETPVLVESARALPAVLNEQNAWFSALSPDGAHIAYYLESGRGKDRVSQICIYTFDGAGKKCYNLPADKWLGYPYQLQWSPDGSMVTFTENPVEFGYDADIWVMKVADGTFSDITDDGVVGSWRQPTGTPGSVVDYLPMWNPADGKIYFWRFQSSGEYMVFTVGIYRIAATGGDAELVQDLTQAIPMSTVLFKQEVFFMDGPSAMSPDGKNIAALVSTADEMGAVQVSLWQIPVDGTGPKQLMAPDAFNAALPEWSEWPAVPVGTAWTADSKGIVTFAVSNDTHTPFMVFYYTDVASGTSTPVVDFKSVADPEGYFEPAPGGTIPWRAYSPWSGSMSPKGDKVLMVTNLGGTIGLLTAQLPPSGSLPVISASTDSPSSTTASRSSRSVDGKVTVYGLLLKVKE